MFETLRKRNTPRYPAHEVTPAQKEIADAVRRRLSEAQVVYRETFTAVPEAIINFELASAYPETLSFHVVVVGDRVILSANGADLGVDFPPEDEPRDWIVECDLIFASLLEHDLRIRVRSGLFGTHGALWIPSKQSWNGDYRSMRGKGEETTYPHPWFQR